MTRYRTMRHTLQYRITAHHRSGSRVSQYWVRVPKKVERERELRVCVCYLKVVISSPYAAVDTPSLRALFRRDTHTWHWECRTRRRGTPCAHFVQRLSIGPAASIIFLRRFIHLKRCGVYIIARGHKLL